MARGAHLFDYYHHRIEYDVLYCRCRCDLSIQTRHDSISFSIFQIDEQQDDDDGDDEGDDDDKDE